jgi:hypothetical protein
MRASLFLSALFCASLIGGAAAAEKPDKEHRAKGDMHERYSKPASDKTRNEVHVQATKVDRSQTPLRIRQAAERIRCSEAQEDCGRGSARSAASKTEKSDNKVAQKGASNETAKLKAMMQKMVSAKCGARARGGCSGHDDPY